MSHELDQIGLVDPDLTAHTIGRQDPLPYPTANRHRGDTGKAGSLRDREKLDGLGSARRRLIDINIERLLLFGYGIAYPLIEDL
ncbi:hypothetical protein BFN67_15205 [Pseudaminobacter manganicus]|uniref:Uncharacterized protein n=1 Tax=Manganibacter manganicus TaxID=1873176 RepID=A0A1V8RST0_9HYPH|nr:hypothetical protein [Pseudaminobacter manganicus]OQM76240.1 hypothetical protein BFN67_15205 [Pseudaminobacter manganicus]